MSAPILSVFLIVKNEAACIAECIESVSAVADEIIVADTGSEDNTAEIARAAGATVVSIRWENDFAAARNTAMSHASGDWLLHMDADEILDPASARDLRRMIDDSDFPADAVEITLANYSDDPRSWRWIPAPPNSPFRRGYAGYLPVPLLRLFRNGRGYAYREAIHENITASVKERGGRIMESDLLIHHYGYEPSAERRAGKHKQYLALARIKCEQEPDSVKAWADRAEQALACGEEGEAETAARRARALDPGHLGAATTLANILLNRKAFAEAQEILEQFHSRETPVPHVEAALAAIEYHSGQLLEARVRLEHLLVREPRAVMARIYLARVYDISAETRRAEKELVMARDMAPGVGEFERRVQALHLRSKAESAFQGGLVNEALEMIVEALRLDHEDPVTLNDLGVVLNALGQRDKARDSFRKALELVPGYGEAQENLRLLAAAG